MFQRSDLECVLQALLGLLVCSGGVNFEVDVVQGGKVTVLYQ